MLRKIIALSLGQQQSGSNAVTRQQLFKQLTGKPLQQPVRSKMGVNKLLRGKKYLPRLTHTQTLALGSKPCASAAITLVSTQ